MVMLDNNYSFANYKQINTIGHLVTNNKYKENVQIIGT